MEIYRKTLKNGIEFASARTDAFKSAEYMLTFVLPYDREAAAAYLLVAELLSQPTEKYPTLRSLSIVKDELYALSVSSYSSKYNDSLVVRFRISATADSFAFDGEKILEGALALLHEILFHPKKEGGIFPAENFETKKKQIIDEINSLIEDKPAFAMARARALLCEGEISGMRPEEEDVKALDGQTVFNYYEKMLRDAPAFVAYAGEAEPEYVAELTEKYIDFPARKFITQSCSAHIAKSEVKRVTEHADMEQCIVTLGFSDVLDGTMRRKAAAFVFDEIFGAGSTSKLFVNVREKAGLCYFCSSAANGRKNVTYVQCGTEKGSEEKVIKAIYKELDAMKSGDFSETDMDTAKKSLISAYRASEGHLTGNLGLMNTILLYGEPADFQERLIAAVAAVTKEDVVAFANTVVPELEHILEGED